MTGKRQYRSKLELIGNALTLVLLTVFLTSVTPLITANESILDHASISDVPVPTQDVPEEVTYVPETVVPVIDTAPLPMADVWFDDAVFIGDSRMEGFKLYAGLPNAQYLAAVGATVDSVYSSPTQRAESGEKVSIMESLESLHFTKAYIMLGLNELGWPDPAQFETHYARVIDSIRDISPAATVYIQSILPVTAAKDAEGGYINNDRIRLFNETLQSLAAEKDALYLDVASVVAGEDGTLPAEKSADGIHLQPAPCKDWLQYLKTHTTAEDLEQEGE